MWKVILSLHFFIWCVFQCTLNRISLKYFPSRQKLSLNRFLKEPKKQKILLLLILQSLEPERRFQLHFTCWFKKSILTMSWKNVSNIKIHRACDASFLCFSKYLSHIQTLLNPSPFFHSTKRRWLKTFKTCWCHNVWWT